MNANQFLAEFHALCLKYCIDSALAVENESIRAAIKARNLAEIERVLCEEF